MLLALIELKLSVAVSMSLILKIFSLFTGNMKNCLYLSSLLLELILISSILPAIISKFKMPVVKSLFSSNATLEVVYPFEINLLVISVRRFLISFELNSE